MEDHQLPSPAGTQLLVDVRGAEIISSSSDDPDVYLPHHEELISHIALDVSNQRRPAPSTPVQAAHELTCSCICLDRRLTGQSCVLHALSGPVFLVVCCPNPHDLEQLGTRHILLRRLDTDSVPELTSQIPACSVASRHARRPEWDPRAQIAVARPSRLAALVCLRKP